MRTDFITPSSQLQRSLKKLQEKWIETRAQWDDNLSDRFQQRYLEPLVPQSQLALAAMHELMKVLHDADEQTADPETGEFS